MVWDYELPLIRLTDYQWRLKKITYVFTKFKLRDLRLTYLLTYICIYIYIYTYSFLQEIT